MRHGVLPWAQVDREGCRHDTRNRQAMLAAHWRGGYSVLAARPRPRLPLPTDDRR
jgi:hypothetical protein